MYRFVLLVLLLLVGCVVDAGPVFDSDEGPIEDIVDDVTRTVWPGVDIPTGRHVRLLNGFYAGAPSAYWFAGFASRRSANVFWFCPEDAEGCPFDADGTIDRERTVGDPIFSVVPGDPGYSPFWLIWVVHVPPSYEPNSIKSQAGLEQALLKDEVSMDRAMFDHGGVVGTEPAMMHCLLVLKGTELEGNGAPAVGDGGGGTIFVPAQSGWSKQRSLQFYDFTEDSGVFAPAPSSESVPLMPSADIFVFFRDCAGGSTSAVCAGATGALGAVSERGVELDLNADGDRADNNNIISGFPRTINVDPMDRTYSPLWQVRQVRIPPEHEDDLALIDDTGDQDNSMARSPADVRALVEAGLLDPPIPISEMDSGDSIPGNDGDLFFNCPSQVPEP